MSIEKGGVVVSILDLFKKKDSSPAPSPITRFDEKVASVSAPLSSSSRPQLPPMPSPASMPSLPPMQRPAMPSLPPMQPRPAPVSPAPAVPRIPPKTLGDMPKISVDPYAVTPTLVAPKPVPPVVPQPPKLENSRLAKALEELTNVDFHLDEPAPKPVPVAKPVEIPARPVGPKQKFIGMPVFDNCLRELKQVQIDLTETQANNERLGMLENQKKNSYETMVGNFEHMQKQLLIMDEKLFKVK